MGNNSYHLKSLLPAVGAGLLAGLAGTAAMSIFQKITEKITGNKPDESTVAIAKKILNYYPSKGKELGFANAVTYSYGSANGIIRSLLSFAGTKNFNATAIHFGIISAMVITVEPMLDVAPALLKRNPEKFALTLFHHALYAVVTGLVFDTIIKKLNSK